VTGPASGHPFDGCDHGGLLAVTKLADGSLGRAIEIAPGIVGEEIENGFDPGIGERSPLLGTNAPEAPHVQPVEGGEGSPSHSIENR
jgi:hypothetical protein